MAKLIPDRGAWMEFETRKNDYIFSSSTANALYRSPFSCAPWRLSLTACRMRPLKMARMKN